MLINYKSVDEIRNITLNKWKEILPSANLAQDGQIYMDATALAEAIWSVQTDAFLLAEEAFIPYATGERLSNLGIEKGILRKDASVAVVDLTFARAVKSGTSYIIPAGTEVSTQPDVNGFTWNFTTDEAATIYGTLTVPVNLQGSTSTSGGSLPASQPFYYVITAIDGVGQETTVSNEVLVTTGLGATNSVQLTWDAVSGAVEYKVYVGYATGDESFLASSLSTIYTHVAGVGDGLTMPPVTNDTGTTSVLVSATARVAGVGGNVPAGAINVLVDTPAGVETVNNILAASGGANEETDQEYRDRMQLAFISGSIQSKTTKSGYEQTAIGVSGVRTAKVVNPNTGAFRNEFYIYITSEGQSGIPSQPLIDEVQAEVNLDSNRSPNDVITVLSPSPVTVDVTVIILEYDSTFSESQLQSAVQANIADYINSLATGESVYVVGIENAIFDTNGVIDFDLITPTTNLSITETQKAVPGNIVVA